MDLWTWNPFHSKQTKEICAHMTPKEKRRFARNSAICGLCIGLFAPISIGRPVVQLIHGEALAAIDYGVFSLGIIALTAGSIAMRRRIRQLLTGTEWASQQGYSADKLKLDFWG